MAATQGGLKKRGGHVRAARSVAGIRFRKNFSFRCHREKPTERDLDNVYAVNRISCHPTGIFTTAGSDGMYNFWDKESKQRVWKPAQKANSAVTATAFNRTGTMLAYAVGYDWSKGVESYNPAFKTAILIKTVTDEQIKVKPKAR